MDTKETVINIITSVCSSLKVGVEDHDKSLKDLGVDSLDLSGILLEIEEKFGIKIPDSDIEHLTSINSIVAYISIGVLP